MSEGDRHLPGRHLIDAYGGGGFRFADLGHRGSLLIVPSGMRAWPVSAPAEVTEDSLALVFREAAAIDLFLFGAGEAMAVLPETLRWRFREARIGVEVMTTGAAARTYNILLGERRPVAAGLIAVS